MRSEADRISRAPLSVQRYSWDDFKRDVAGVASVGRQAVEALGPAVTSGMATVAQAVGGAPAWRDVQVDWNSAPGTALRAWAAQLDPSTVQAARAGGPAGVLGVVTVPEDVAKASADLASQSLLYRQPPPTVLPGPIVTPTVTPGPPTPFIPAPPAPLLAILIFIAIMLWPSTTPESAETTKLAEDKKRQLEKQKEENEKERGRCRETVPALRGAVHQATIQELDRNAEMYLFQRLGDTPRTKEDRTSPGGR